MSKMGKRLIQGAKEALAIARGAAAHINPAKSLDCHRD